MKIIITESQLRKIVSSIISKKNNNIYGIKQGMDLIYESKSEENRKIKQETTDKYIKIMEGYNGSWTEFKKDEMFYTIRKFFIAHYQYFRDYKWVNITSKLFPNKNEQTNEKKINEYIKIMETYNSFNDFKKDKEFINIYSFFNKYYHDDQYYNWKNIILEKFPKKNEDRWEISKEEKRVRFIEYMKKYNSWNEFFNKKFYFNKISRFFLKYYNYHPYYNWETLSSKIFPDKDV